MSKKTTGNAFEEYQKREEILKVLTSQKKPLTRLEFKQLGVDASRRSLRQLEKVGRIDKEEHRLDNSGKTYLDADKKIQKVLGTRYYTYSLVV